jgi:hypothetical protein
MEQAGGSARVGLVLASRHRTITVTDVGAPSRARPAAQGCRPAGAACSRRASWRRRSRAAPPARWSCRSGCQDRDCLLRHPLGSLRRRHATRTGGGQPHLLGRLPRRAIAVRGASSCPGHDLNWLPGWEALTPLDAAQSSDAGSWSNGCAVEVPTRPSGSAGRDP